MASHCVVAFEGRALGGVSAVAEAVHPEKLGTSTMVRLVQDAEMAEVARLLVGRGGFSGFAGLDFVRDEASGKLWFLKFTPRPTPLAHLGHLAGGDLCLALLAAVSGTSPARQRATKETTVALFPQDWMRDPDAADRGAEHLDVPTDDARLLAALGRLAKQPAAGLRD
jgi:predicted ATP-grasp superfamily ATP-dependent carboligase